MYTVGANTTTDTQTKRVYGIGSKHVHVCIDSETGRQDIQTHERLHRTQMTSFNSHAIFLIIFFPAQNNCTIITGLFNNLIVSNSLASSD